MSLPRPLSTSFVIAGVLSLLVGCGSSGSGELGASGPASGAYPVTVQSCGQPLTVAQAPSRAVTTDLNMTEMMIALGLESRMAGSFSTRTAPGMSTAVTAGFARIPNLSDDQLELEPLVAAKPDLLFAGYNYGLNAAKNLTPEALTGYGIDTYVLTESCAHVAPDKKTVSIDNTYADLTALGTIFGIPDRAAAVVNEMKGTVAAAQERVAGRPARSVFLYDSGEAAPFTAPGLAMPNAMIELGGGRNIFADVSKTWGEVAWEQVAARKPECIIINDYGTPNAAAKRAFLETFPLTRNLPAVRNGCFLNLTYDELTPGPLNADAIAKIARWLHPDAA